MTVQTLKIGKREFVLLTKRDYERMAAQARRQSEQDRQDAGDVAESRRRRKEPGGISGAHVGVTVTMNGEQIVMQARKQKADFGLKCSKFSGAVSVEILKAALAEEGIRSSPRDVFIRGIPVELDLIIPREGQEAVFGLLYEPAQVAAVLEVKNSGSFGQGTLEKLRRDLGRCREAGIPWAYVTLEERVGFRWAASRDQLGCPCFTLAWHRTTDGPIEPTEDWHELVTFLRERIRARHGA